MIQKSIGKRTEKAKNVRDLTERRRRSILHVSSKLLVGKVAHQEIFPATAQFFPVQSELDGEEKKMEVILSIIAWIIISIIQWVFGAEIWRTILESPNEEVTKRHELDASYTRFMITSCWCIIIPTMITGDFLTYLLLGSLLGAVNAVWLPQKYPKK